MASRNTTQTHKYVRRCHTQEKRCADTFHHGAHLIFLSVQTIVAVSGCVCVFVYKWLKPKEPKNAAVTATMDGVVVVDVLNCRGARGSIRYVKQLKDPLAALHTAAASLFSLNNEGLMALIN